MICTRCNRDGLVSSDFYKDVRKGGRTTYCKECLKGLSKAGYVTGKRNAYLREWKRLHPGWNTIHKQNHRAKKLNGGHHTKEEWQDKLSKYNNKCAYCHREVRLHKDHIIPLSKGGSNSIDNLQPLCASCNASKGNRLIISYTPWFKERTWETLGSGITG